MYSKVILLFFCLGIFFTACEKEFNITVPAAEKKAVVEGYIENGLPPFLYLSSSLDIFSSLNLSSISNSYLHNAKVTVSDGTRTMLLKEYPVNLGGITVYIYTVNGLDFSGTAAASVNFPGLGPVGVTAAFNPDDIGKLNTTYQLSIQLENETAPSITASTTIFYQQKIDSLWYEKRANQPASDTLVRVYARLIEDGTQKNYYRYFTSQNNGRFLPGLNSVYNDDFTNGSTYSVRVDRGVDKTLPDSLLYKHFGYFYKGDKVTVKVCQIDKGSFEFWQTLEYAKQNTGNPFASPTNVKGNINGGYGIWSGYAAYYKTLSIPR